MTPEADRGPHGAGASSLEPPSTRAAGRRSRQLAGKLSLLVGGIVFSLVILEIWARLFSDVPPPISERDPQIGRRYLPGFEGRVFDPECGQKIFLRFNRDGFRGPDLPYEKPANTRRIAMLGDSMVAALAVSEESTAARRLESLMNGDDDETLWQVQNFGVAAASTGQEMALYRKVVARYRPDIVLVVYFLGNDFADNSSLTSHYPRIYFALDENGQLVQEPYAHARNTTSAWLNRYSRFYVWQKKANDVFRNRRQRAGKWVFDTDPDERLSEVWELNEKLIETFRAEVAKRGSRFVLVLYPCAEQIYEDVWDEMMTGEEDPARYDRDYPEKRILAMCRKRGIPVVSITEDARRAAPAGRASDTDPADWLFFQARGHFNDAGNDLAARVIHRFLTEGAGRATIDRSSAEDDRKSPGRVDATTVVHEADAHAAESHRHDLDHAR